MLIIAWTMSGILVVLTAVMWLLQRHYLGFYEKLQSLDRGDYCPKVGVVMPLRGSDPYLKRCLTALTELDYPDFVIQVIVDNELDPARKVVEEVLAETQSDRLKVDNLADFTDTCSLRNSALRQAYNCLPEDCEVIVQVDADAYPYRNWLSDLVAGLKDDKVGVACGVRWFAPTEPTIANLTRHVWNAGAIVQMQPLNIGWGGSFAMKREAFEKAKIYDRWGQSLFDDTFTTDSIIEAGYQLQVVPRVTMVNEESNDFKGCRIFITRQLLNLRLYHRAFKTVFLYGVGAGLITFSAFSILFWLLFTQEFTGAGILAVAIVIYFLGQTGMMRQAEFVIQRAQSEYNRPPSNISSFWKLPFAVFLALVMHPYCLIRALGIRQVTWRGITYKFTGPLNVRRINYEPYIPAESLSTQSL